MGKLVTLFNESTKNAVKRNRRPTRILGKPKTRDIFAAFYCDLEIKLKNLNRWNCVIVHISFNGIEIEPFLSPVGEVPPTLPIQWDLEDRYSTSNDNFYYGPMMFLRWSTTGNNDVI